MAKGWKFSKVQLERLRLAHIGIRLSEKTKKKLSEALKGKNTGALSHKWRGGRHLHNGYVKVFNNKHPYAVDRGRYIREHRLVIENYIGRYLLPAEEPHHLNKVTTDNRPKNLMAFVNHSAHMRFEKGGIVNPEEIIFDGRLL